MIWKNLKYETPALGQEVLCFGSNGIVYHARYELQEDFTMRKNPKYRQGKGRAKESVENGIPVREFIHEDHEMPVAKTMAIFDPIGNYDIEEKITHWMPVPEFPIEKVKK